MLNISANLRLNMTGAEADPEQRALRYRCAIDMAEYADRNGFSSVNVEEHHVAENGWLPSPLTMAAAIAGRTDQCSIGVMALLVSLYDPIRLAEDIAVIDLPEGQAGIEWDVRACESFVADPGHWRRLRPGEPQPS